MTFLQTTFYFIQAKEATEATTKIWDKLLHWWDLFIVNLPNLAIAIVVMLIAYFLSKFVFSTTIKIAGTRIQQRSITRLIARFTATIVVLVGLFLALGALNLGETLTTLLSAAGISGLVIGLALQGTLANTFSGIVLSFRKNVKIGQWIETSGYAGEVMDINLNYFVLKEADNNMVILPNKTILDNAMKNYSLTTEMRVTISCGVGYSSDLDKVEELTKRVINDNFDQEAIGKEMEFFYTEFGDSSINFITRFWVDAENSIAKLRAQNTAIKLIKKAFDSEGINIPFPIRTLQFDNKLQLNNNSEEK